MLVSTGKNEILSLLHPRRKILEKIHCWPLPGKTPFDAFVWIASEILMQCAIFLPILTSPYPANDMLQAAGDDSSKLDKDEIQSAINTANELATKHRQSKTS